MELRAERSIWNKMIIRCTDSSSENFAYYGGRGIKVFQPWLGAAGFERFIADVGPRPGRYLTLDRIDTNGDYEPTNVRWATRLTQAQNRVVPLKPEPPRDHWAQVVADEVKTLVKLLCDAGWMANDIAEAIGTGRTSLYAWRLGDRDMPAKKLLALRALAAEHARKVG